MNRLLVTDGKGEFKEIEYVCPPPGPNEIQVKSLMTGVCRSDVDMMVGKFGPLPNHMSGHEGLGEIIAVGSELQAYYHPGEYVATRGEPAYADVYTGRQREFVVVPDVDPKYILEPVACGINLIVQPLRQVNKVPFNPKILIIGTGMLAWVAHNALGRLYLYSKTYSPKIHVLGKHNLDLWSQVSGVEIIDTIPSNHKYDFIVDLSSGDEVFKTQCLSENGLYILASEKHPTVNTSFGFLLWGSNTIICPSPRGEFFYGAMTLAADWVSSGKLDVSHFWTKGYDRNTEWQQAFADGLNRPANYSRGYIKW